jgi:Fur family ferric uptake transcriptional regulator
MTARPVEPAPSLTGINQQADNHLLGEAERLLRQTAARITPARRAVLAQLLGASGAMSHAEVEHQLSLKTGPVDRVTVYRVLEWLTDQQLAHKIAGEDRVWRFNAALDNSQAHQHAHFKCQRCQQVFCLPAEALPSTQGLPPGYIAQSVELLVKGICAGCA